MALQENKYLELAKVSNKASAADIVTWALLDFEGRVLKEMISNDTKDRNDEQLYWKFIDLIIQTRNNLHEEQK